MLFFLFFCFIFFFPLACQGLGGVSWPGEQQWPLIERSPPSVTPRVGPHLSSYVTSWHTSQLPSLFPWSGTFSSCLVGQVVVPPLAFSQRSKSCGCLLLWCVFCDQRHQHSQWSAFTQHFLLQCCVLLC